MAITAEARTEIIQLVVGMFGAAPGASVLSDLVAAKEAGQSVKQIAANVANTNEFKSIYPTFLTNQEFAERFVNNLVGSEVAAADKAAAVTILVGQLNAGATRSNVIVDAINAVKAVPSTNTAWANAAAALNNKVSVATYYSVDKQLSGSTLAALQNVIATVTSTAASVTAAKTSVDGTANVGQVFTLTTGGDTFNGGAGVDTFNAVETTSTTPTFTVGDSLDGGAGSDTLNITQTKAFTTPLATSVTNIETIKLVVDNNINLNSTSWTGLTSLNATSKGVAAAGNENVFVAAATTDVSATVSGMLGDDSGLTVNGGKNVTVAASGSTADGDGANEIVIGATTAAAGAVVVTNTTSAAVDQVDVAVTGGTSVTITESLTNAVNTTGTQGNVTVTGGTATTAVTVNQDKAATASATVVGKVTGTVTIADRNAASATTAGVISTVSLNSYGNSTIDSSAISTVNLAGTAGTLTISRGALTAVPTANTLALNLTGLGTSTTAAGAITDGEAAGDDGFTTVNITGSTTASYVADLVVADATTINVAGDAKVTLNANTGFGAVTAVTVTNTAGSSFGTAFGTGVLFTGGAGADTISLSNAFTKAITMGAGDDTVTYGGAAGTGGSVAAGDGSDTIVMTGAQADAADASSTFNTKFTGFEVLDVASSAATDVINLAGINGVNKVVTRGATGLTLDGFATGGTLTLDAAGTNLTANVTNAVLTAGDTFNVALSTAAAAAIGFGSVTLAGIETVNISTVDGGTAASAATIGTATLVATAATKVVVSGNNGLTLTNTGNTAITTFDASGVVGNSTSTAVDTAANLGVTFTSANVTTTATVTMTGGAGNDTLTGAAAKDTINGGAGADTVGGGLGVDTITVGEGRDIVVVNSTAGTSTDSGTAAFDSVTGFKVSEVISTAVDLSGTVGAHTNANFQAATAGGVNASLLSLDIDAAAADQAITIEPTATNLAGQAVGVTYSVSARGILTLGGTGASAVDTLAEWLTEASAVAATLGDILAFEFGGDTYVFAENAAQDVLVKLVGVTGATGLVEVSAATTSTTAGAILYADIA